MALRYTFAQICPGLAVGYYLFNLTLERGGWPVWCSQSASFSDGEDWAVVVYGKAEQNVVVFTNHLCSRDDDLRDLDWHCLFDCVLFPCARLRVPYQDLSGCGED